MVNYQPPSYPQGTMLTVVRRGAANAKDWQGDPIGPEATHQIGPCDLKWVTDSEDNTSGELLVLVAQVTAPAGSDVIASDRIRLPNGNEFVIDGQVRDTPNSFTGWSSGVRFRIAKDGGSGIRRN
ncbi:hypothetical protein [Nocardia sp. CC227C]|uniref:hypothetical protein n=1 Tax=Nocardia sp. CC227C TaxID=3044562 RepID=UPI00278C32C2|nr:hypothetical protein [Nocardia sp. CC227C]